MSSVNKVILVGNLGRDAELKYAAGGAAVSTLSIATCDIWTDKAGRKQERTEWHRVILFGKTAEALAEYLVRGKQIYVEGKLQTRKWTDKDGVERYTTEVRGDRIVLLGSGPRREPNGGHLRDEEVGTPADPASQHAALDDDIPF